MTLQLVELTLLDTNLQIHHSVRRGSTHLHPSSGDAMRFLHGIGSARLDGTAKYGLDGDRDGQEH
jgi:hypothetical protein